MGGRRNGDAGCTLATASFVPPPPEHLLDCLTAWERFLHEDALPPLVQAALMHAQFEAIHPFLDGNGRVGRLLITLLLVAQGALPSPLLYLSAWFEATRPAYYARLAEITDAGAWEAWLQTFLNGAANQAEDALDRIARIGDLLESWRANVAKAPSRLPEKAVDLLAENPFWTVRRLAEWLGAAFTTAQRAIDRLERAGIVTLTSEARRNRVYCAHAILEILEAPPRILDEEAAWRLPPAQAGGLRSGALPAAARRARLRARHAAQGVAPAVAAPRRRRRAAAPEARLR